LIMLQGETSMMVYITMVMIEGTWEIVNAFDSEKKALEDAEELHTIEGFAQVKIHPMYVQ
jgi:hypothetical protein